MNISIKALFSCLMGLFLISSLNSMENPAVEPMSIEKAQSKADFELWLQQEDAKLWQDLYKVYGIDQATCQQLKVEHKAEYDALVQEMIQNDRIGTEISQPLKGLIGRVIDDFGCDKELLKIVPFARHAPVGSTDDTLFVDERCIPAPMPREVKKYVVGLGVAMALNGDHSTDFVLAKLRQIKNIQASEELTQVMLDYETLKAVRADMKTMFLGSDYRAGQGNYVQRLMNQQGDAADKSDYARYIIGQYMTRALA